MNLAIVGSGVTGQATGRGLARHGHKPVFYDIDDSKLTLLKESGYEISRSLSSAVQESDIVFVCVPTPTVDGSMSFSYVEDAVTSVAKALEGTRKYRVIVVRSTVLPSTTRCRVIPILEKHSRMKVGEDFGVCMNPEFLREKSAFQDFLNPERIVIGEHDARSGNMLEKVYSGFDAPLIRTDLDTAEMIKYAANLFLASKISFFNEIHMICNRLRLDSEVISEAVSLDSRIGKYGTVGGRLFDGKCLPKDLEAFRTFARSINVNPKLLDAISIINEQIVSSEKLNGG